VHDEHLQNFILLWAWTAISLDLDMLKQKKTALAQRLVSMLFNAAKKVEKDEEENVGKEVEEKP
jgi:hypothetical protein